MVVRQLCTLFNFQSRPICVSNCIHLCSFLHFYRLTTVQYGQQLSFSEIKTELANCPNFVAKFGILENLESVRPTTTRMATPSVCVNFHKGLLLNLEFLPVTE